MCEKMMKSGRNVDRRSTSYSSSVEFLLIGRSKLSMRVINIQQTRTRIGNDIDRGQSTWT